MSTPIQIIHTIQIYWFVNNDQLLPLGALGNGGTLQATLRDPYRLQLRAVNNPNPIIQADGTVDAASQVDLTNVVNGVFGVKTQTSYDAGGNFDVSFPGFDTSDPLNVPSKGQLTWPFVLVPSRVTVGTPYVGVAAVLDSTNNRLNAGLRFGVNVNQDVFIGSESSLPSGTGIPIFGDAEITPTSGPVPVPVLGMTAGGRALVWQEGAQTDSDWGGIITPQWSYGVDTLTISAGSAPSAGTKFKFGYWVIKFA